tara:strand:+ start:22264 stop:22914 length:651 start_codon:yes stop_codon:yes gene_type:complete
VKRRLPASLLVAVVILLGFGDAAWAKEVSQRKMRFVERGTNLTVTTSFTDILDPDDYASLSSGFPTRIVLHIVVYQEGSEIPVAIQQIRRRVVYDLWDETYLLEVKGPRGTKQTRFESRVQLLRELTQLRRHPIAKLSKIGIGPHYVLAVVAQLNPVEEERMAEMRRWLTKSSSDSNLDSSSSFFGTFVSVFANSKLGKADRVVRLQSQPFYRVQP